MNTLMLLAPLLMISLPCINNMKEVTSWHFWCIASKNPINNSMFSTHVWSTRARKFYFLMQNSAFLKKIPVFHFLVTYHLQKAVELQDQPGASSLSPFGWQCHSQWRQTLSHSQLSPACSLHLCQPCSLALLHHKWKHPTSCTDAINKRV